MVAQEEMDYDDEDLDEDRTRTGIFADKPRSPPAALFYDDLYDDDTEGDLYDPYDDPDEEYEWGRER